MHILKQTCHLLISSALPAVEQEGLERFPGAHLFITIYTSMHGLMASQKKKSIIRIISITKGFTVKKVEIQMVVEGLQNMVAT